jgi:hypothetical protein
MANSEKNFDQYFRKKLETHEEKPSALAWERLESQLPKNERKGYFPLLKIAAAIIILLAAGVVLLNWTDDELPAVKQVAELDLEKVSSSTQNQEIETFAETEVIPSPKEEKTDTEVPKVQHPDATPQKQTRPQMVTNPLETAPEKMVASAIAPREESKITEMELPEISLPELKITETIALNNEVEEEPVYKVTIKSKGLKEEAPKQGLIGELEEKVEKIEGIWNKLGQGFADLQDAKENLFANNNPRRERSK